MKMMLFHFARSSSSYRVRIALALKGIAVDYVSVDLTRRENRDPAYAQVNPQRLVPCLETANGTRIGQSLAIIDYLEDVQPEPGLYPEDIETRAQSKNLALIVACEAQPFQASAAARYLARQGFGDADIAAWRVHWLQAALQPIDRFVAQRPVQHDFVFGDRPGVVECCLIPQLHNIDLFGLDVPQLTHLRAIERRCLALDAFRQAHPDAWSAATR